MRAAAIMLCALWLAAGPLAGAGANERVAAGLSTAERLQLRALRALAPESLAEAAAAFSPAQVEAQTRALESLGNLAVGARPLDAEGRAPVHRLLDAEAAALAPAGLEIVGRFRLDLAAPVLTDPAPALTVAGEVFPILPLYPNGVMPSLAPAGGLSGPLVDVGAADWGDLDGLDLRGAIAVMDFRGGRNHERLFGLGAVAVVVVEGPALDLRDAEALYSMTPLPYPRYFADAGTGARLRAHAGHRADLRGGHLYASRPAETTAWWLPPTAPQSRVVAPGTVVEEVALAAGVDPAAALRENPPPPGGFRPGDALRLPGRDAVVTLRPQELLERWAARYGVLPAELAAANGLAPGADLAPGQSVVLPNAPTPLLLFCPVDSLSVVPDAPHGALVRQTLAATLALVRHLAGPGVVRRRGLLVVFTDGDTLGGAASRSVAEAVLTAQGRFRRPLKPGQIEVLPLYEGAAPWFAGAAPSNPAAARWLAETWLRERLEKTRVNLAGARVLALDAVRAGPPEPARGAALAELEADLAAVSRLRREALDQVALSPGERLARLARALAEPTDGPRWERLGVALGALAERFAAERAQETRARANADGNARFAQDLLARLGVTDGPPPATLGLHLDLAAGDHGLSLLVGTGGEAEFRLRGDFFVPASLRRAFENRLRRVSALAAQVGGWPEEFLWLGEADKADAPMLTTFQPPCYEDFWRAAGVALLPVGTRNDRRERLDTPHDTLAGHGPAEWGRLAVQGRTLAVVLRLLLESPVDSRGPGEVRPIDYGKVEGRTVQFDARSGIDARDPVAGALVILPSTPQISEKVNSLGFRGVRRAPVVLSRLSGAYEMPLEVRTFNTKDPQVHAYVLDPVQAVLVAAANEGQVGTQQQRSDFEYRANLPTEKNLVLAPVYPLVVFPGLDPREYRAIGGHYITKNRIDLIDAVLDGPPREWAVDNPHADYGEKGTEALIAYLAPGRRLRLIQQSGVRYRMLLAGDPGEGFKGEGYLVGPPGDGDRGLYQFLTPLRLAEDQLAAAANRLRLYRSFGIRQQAAEVAVERAEKLVQQAREAATERRWGTSVGDARAAWGIMIKAYPEVLNLGREAVFSVIVLMGLLAPGAFFLERLVLGGKGVLARLGGAAGLFLAGVVFLGVFHPAFRVAVSPFIVVIAFTMILMSVVVLALSYQRFEVLLRRARAQAGESESEEISLLASLSTAFSLGVSNLRKRAARTLLTTLTVAVLTFSIVAFVAVSGRDALARVPVPLDTFTPAGPVEPLPPAFNGLLFRDAVWKGLDASRLSAAQTEFGSRFEVAPRAFYIEEEGGNAAAREGVNQIRVTGPGGSVAVLTGLVLLGPQEPRFSGLERAVDGGHWFDAGDRDVVLLPRPAADRLGLRAEDLRAPDGTRRAALPEVFFQGRRWRVGGIFDPAVADRVRDANGKSLAIVDHVRSAISSSVADVRIDQEGQHYHLPWDQLAILPYAAVSDVGAKLRAVAVRFPEGFDPEPLYADLAKRLNTAFFATHGGRTEMVVTRQETDVSGLAKILLPIVLCVLIVMNTMLGTVEERKGEVAMLGAIGLSPRQISFLLLSEATVYSILGMLAGVFAGLVFANAVPWINALGLPFLTGVSFNFTSLLSIVLALGTGLVVLVATLVPAAQAAKLAAPSGMARWELPATGADGAIAFTLPFTLTRGNAVGMAFFLRQFLLNHTEVTSPDFNCREVALETVPEGLALRCRMFLAPYDLDVSQDLAVVLRAAGAGGVFAVDLRLTRRSGAEEAWVRTNYGFLNLVRQQFLLWRNLEGDLRQRYMREGAEFVRAAAAIPAPAPAHA